MSSDDEETFYPYAPFIYGTDIIVSCICGNKLQFSDSGCKTCDCGRIVIVGILAYIIDIDGRSISLT